MLESTALLKMQMHVIEQPWKPCYVPTENLPLPVNTWPVSPDEITKAKIGWKDSSAGPDRVTVTLLKCISNQRLTVLFTAISLRNIQLESFDQFRMVLIDKKATHQTPLTGKPLLSPRRYNASTPQSHCEQTEHLPEHKPETAWICSSRRLHGEYSGTGSYPQNKCARK